MLVTASVAGTPTSESTTLLTLKNYVLGGTAATATKLATPRTINGVAFDGSANIVISADISTQNAASATKLATARTINGVSFDGTANITIPSGSVVFSSITSLPTTIAGFGITDGATLTGTQTLTNKTLTAPNISSIVNTGTLTLPTTTDTLVGRTTTDTLTNKSISGANNTLTAIPNSALTNSSFILNGTTVSLGDNKTITTVLSNALTIGAGLVGGSFNGTSAVTIYVSPADASNIGGVRVPAVGTSGITNSSGTIGLALATTTQVGGVFVDGTSITAASGIITANAGGLSGTTLKSTVVNSSLTSVGTLTSVTVSGTTTLATSLSGMLKATSGVVSTASAGTDYASPSQTFYIGTTQVAIDRSSASLSLAGVSVDGSAGSVPASALTGTTLASGVVNSSLTSVGTLTSLTVTNATLIGSQANLTRFPNAQVVVSTTAAGIQQNETHNIGIMAEGVAHPSNPNIYGVGLYGAGYTSATTRSGGVVGEGHVSASTDVGSAIGVRGYANDTHAGGLNVGLYGDATSGSSNYALYMNRGDIYSGSSQSWVLNGNLAFSGAYTVSVPALTSTGAVAVNSASGITTNQTSIPVVNTTATTVNFAGAATTVAIGASSGNTTVNNNLNVTGTLKQNGIVVPNLITMLAYQLAL